MFSCPPQVDTCWQKLSAYREFVKMHPRLCGNMPTDRQTDRLTHSMTYRAPPSEVTTNALLTTHLCIRDVIQHRTVHHDKLWLRDDVTISHAVYTRQQTGYQYSQQVAPPNAKDYAHAVNSWLLITMIQPYQLHDPNVSHECVLEKLAKKWNSNEADANIKMVIW